MENRLQVNRPTTYKITALVQGNSVGGGLDSGVNVGGGKNLSDSLIYSEVELAGFPNIFIVWYGRKSGVKNALQPFSSSSGVAILPLRLQLDIHVRMLRQFGYRTQV